MTSMDVIDGVLNIDMIKITGDMGKVTKEASHIKPACAPIVGKDALNWIMTHLSTGQKTCYQSWLDML